MRHSSPEFIKKWTNSLSALQLALAGIDPLTSFFPSIELWLYLIGSATFTWSLGIASPWILLAISKRAVRLRDISKAELEQYLNFAQELLPNVPFPELGQIKRIHSRNSHCFKVAATIRGNWVGIFTLLPVNDHVRRRLNAESINGAAIRDEDIVRPRGQTRTWYLGMIAAKFRYRAAVLQAAGETVKKLLTSPQNAVYARPITKNGLDAARRAGFVAVDGGGAPKLHRLCKVVCAGKGSPLTVD